MAFDLNTLIEDLRFSIGDEGTPQAYLDATLLLYLKKAIKIDWPTRMDQEYTISGDNVSPDPPVVDQALFVIFTQKVIVENEVIKFHRTGISYTNVAGRVDLSVRAKNAQALLILIEEKLDKLIRERHRYLTEKELKDVRSLVDEPVNLTVLLGVSRIVIT